MSFFIEYTIPSNLSTRELLSVINKEKKALNNLKTHDKIVTLDIKKGNKHVTFVPGKKSLDFYSLKSCTEYLTSIGLTIKINALSKHIKKATEFHNFFCRYKKISLSYNFNYEKRDLLVQEYKKRVVFETKKDREKKNKVIIVNNIFEEAEYLFSLIDDTIKDCETIGIKLKSESLKIKNTPGKKHKTL